MITEGRPPARELIAWKKSECVDCEFRSQCPEKLANLVLCYGEDGLQDSISVEALLKRTIRFLCKKQKKDRRDQHRGFIANKRRSWTLFPRKLEAKLICSDPLEYVECQKFASP